MCTNVLPKSHPIMANFTLEFKAADKSGQRRVYICISHAGSRTKFFSGYRVTDSELIGNKLRSNSPVKLELDTDLLTAQQTVKAMGVRIRAYTIQDIAKAVKNAIDKSHQLATNEADFIEYGYELAQRKGNKSTANGYRFVLSAIAKFSGERLPFTSLTKRWLLGFEAYLRKSGVAQSTIATYMRRIRTIHRAAQAELNDDELGDYVVPFDPFKSYKIPAEITMVERHISVDDIRIIFTHDAATTRETLAQDIFILSLALMGMNAIDLYNAPAPSQGRITYRRTKIAERVGAAATISVKVIPEVAHLLSKYAPSDSRRAFSFSELYTDVENFRRAVNKGLESICRAHDIPIVTFYYARHAFAEIAHQHLGYSLDDVAKCLNHSSQTRSVTFRYAGKDYARIDEIQREVVRYISERLNA